MSPKEGGRKVPQEENWLTPENIATFEEKLGRYKNLPDYTKIPEDQQASFIEQITLAWHPSAETLAQNTKTRLAKLVDKKKYSDAVHVVDATLANEITKLPDDDQLSARRMILYHKGSIHEKRATEELDCHIVINDVKYTIYKRQMHI